MIEKSELLRVPAFAGLPDDQIDWFLSQSQEINLKAGDIYMRQGDPADCDGRDSRRADSGARRIRRRNDCPFRSSRATLPECCPSRRMKIVGR